MTGAATFTVNASDSEPDAGVGANGCLTASGTCTLHAAIQEANALPDTDTITFTGAGNNIALTADLPNIIQPVVITGTTAPNGAPQTVVDGKNPPNNTQWDGFDLTEAAAGSSISNLIIFRMSDDGISLASNPYTITNVWSGVMADGITPAPNGRDGLRIQTTAAPPLPGLPGTVIPIDQIPGLLIIEVSNSVFSGNAHYGVHITGFRSYGLWLHDSKVGTGPDGNTAVPNGTGGGLTGGVTIGNGSSINLIGPNNVISANIGDSTTGAGVLIDGQGGQANFPNVVRDNIIGPPLQLTVAAADLNTWGNSRSGIYVVNAQPDPAINQTGFSAVIGPGNQIGFNRCGAAAMGNTPDVNGAGVSITGTSTAVRVIGNQIGLLQAAGGGALAAGNRCDGVRITSGTHSVGSADPAEANVITGNAENGVYLTTTATFGNLIQGNFIGRDPFGNTNPGNGGDGVFIENSGANTVGGANAGEPNVIAGNGFNNSVAILDGNGIGLRGDGDTFGNLFQRNQIFANVELGIDLDKTLSAADANEIPSVDGDNNNPNNNLYANWQQNAPVICNGANTPAAYAAQCGNGAAAGPSFANGNTTVRWTLASAPSSSFRIEFFSTTATGMTFLGETTVTTAAGSQLPVSASCTAAGLCTSNLATGDTTDTTIVMTATRINVDEFDLYPLNDPDGAVNDGPLNNTSEFSAGVFIPAVVLTPDVVRYTSATFNAAEGDGTVNITVERIGANGGAPNGIGTVDLTLVFTNGSASNADYTLPASVTAHWNDGQTGVQTIVVPIVDDNLTEQTETVQLSLVNPPVGTATIGAPATAVLNIADNDGPGGPGGPGLQPVPAPLVIPALGELSRALLLMLTVGGALLALRIGRR